MKMNIINDIGCIGIVYVVSLIVIIHVKATYYYELPVCPSTYALN